MASFSLFRLDTIRSPTGNGIDLSCLQAGHIQPSGSVSKAELMYSKKVYHPLVLIAEIKSTADAGCANVYMGIGWSTYVFLNPYAGIGLGRRI